MTHGNIVVFWDDSVFRVEDDAGHWVVKSLAVRGAGEVFLAQSDHVRSVTRHREPHRQRVKKSDGINGDCKLMKCSIKGVINCHNIISRSIISFRTKKTKKKQNMTT